MSSHGEPDSEWNEMKMTDSTASPASESVHTPASTVPSQSNSEDPRREERSAKAQAILEACKGGDIQALTALAVSEGGFLSDDLRRHAWPILLGSSPSTDPVQHNETTPTTRSAPFGEIERRKTSEKGDAGDQPWQELPRHRDEDQVRLDVDRSFIYYPDPNDTSQADLDHKKTELSDLITETLRRYPYLCYFQGYHDICQVLLLVLAPAQRPSAMARLSALRIRDFMLPNLAPAVAQLRLIPDILGAADPALCAHLSQTEPFFALSGTLTMYAHDIQSYGAIARLFDALLAREPVFGVYMFARIVLNRRAELFDTPASEPEMLHSILSKLPQPLKLEELIRGTVALFARHPPESLPAWRARISPASVLKTARDARAAAAQSMRDGERYFQAQLRELQWAERKELVARTVWSYAVATRKRARSPLARGIVVAVLVGVAAVYLRKAQPGIMTYLASFWSSRRG
ncbi:GTPase-activating protein gyp10 [Apiospora phragmitis]|uniref:GTPase-activating protein gyp10 n=1 Tax=Apiospora phragmitis TaxID=2905665 RepID=A0ABR1X6W5_9PEZI